MAKPRTSIWQRLWSLVDPNEKYLRTIWPRVKQVNALEPEFETLSQQDLQDRLRKIRSRVASARDAALALQTELPPASDTETQRLREAEVVKAEKAILDEHLPEVFAAVREAAKRTLSMRHFDVQLLGGIVLHEGRISEMKTGEGKTLTATCPLVLNALAGRGAHLVTVNDYLARRDAEWMGKIYRYLGLTVGVIQHDLDRVQRQTSYGCDITYITNHEIGFDYLRDHSSAWRPEHLVIRELYYAIVDEVDSILIDEARVPLIISASRGKPLEKYRKVQEVVARLVLGTENEETKETTGDVIVDEKSKNATLTEDGQRKCEIGLGIDNLNDSAHIEDMHLVSSALKANFCYKRDVDYIVGPAEGGVIGVVIVDTFTGRPQPGRRWSDGLHQAIEAKEKVVIQDEQQTIATVTYQNFFLMYKKLAGMTGTAKTEEGEFVEVYEMPVVVVPTNKPMVRIEHPDVVYKNEEWKFRGITAEIVQYYCRRQPVLVGTRSVETSERISQRLRTEPLRMALQFAILQDHLMLNEKRLGKEVCRSLRERTSTPLEVWRPREVVAVLTELGLEHDFNKPENVTKLAEILQVTDEAALRDVLANGVPHEVLNARYHEREASIVAQAGRLGAITIATNMAGRGTDIVLGGNPEPDIEEALANRGIDPKSLQATLFINSALKGDPDAAQAMAEEQGGLPAPVLAEVASIRSAWQAEHGDVVEAGGLHILGTERLESRRIDNQLRGRSGRQGDPGGARFYVSLQDELMRLFGPERWSLLMNQWPEEQPVEAKIITKSMDNAQKKVESRNFDVRKNTLRYDDVMNVQRLHIYAERHRVLQGVDLRNTVSTMMGDLVGEVLTSTLPADGDAAEHDLEAVWEQLNQRFPLKDQIAFDDLLGVSREAIADRLTLAATRAYDDKENDFIRAIVEFELAASIHETLSQVTDRGAVVMVLNALWPLTAYLPSRLDGVQDGRVPEVLYALAREALEDQPKEFILGVMRDRVERSVAATVAAIGAGTAPDDALAELRLDWPLDLARELGGRTSSDELLANLPSASMAALARGGWGFVQEALRRQMDRSVDEWLPRTCDLQGLVTHLDALWPLAGLQARQLETFNYAAVEDRLRRAADEATAQQGLDFLSRAAIHRFQRAAEAAVAEVGSEPLALAGRLGGLLPRAQPLRAEELEADGDLPAALYRVENERHDDLVDGLVLRAVEEVLGKVVEEAHRRMAASADDGGDEENLEAGDLQSLVEQLNTQWALGNALDPWALERLAPSEMRTEMVKQARAAVSERGSLFVIETARLRLDNAIDAAVTTTYSLAGLCRRLNEAYELPGLFDPAELDGAASPAELAELLTETAATVLDDPEDPERFNEFKRSIRGLIDEGWNLRRLCERLNVDYKPTPRLEPKEFAGTTEQDLPAALAERLAPAEEAWRDSFVLEAVRQHLHLTIDEALHSQFDLRTLSQRIGELWPVRPDAVRASKLKGWPVNELGKRLKDTLHNACRAEEWRFIRRFVLRHLEAGLYEVAEQHAPAGLRRTEWNLPALCSDLEGRWPLEQPINPRELEHLSHQQLCDNLMGRARQLYAERERAFIRETAVHRYGLQLEQTAQTHYALERAAAQVNETWGIGEALHAAELARLRTLLAGDRQQATSEIRRLTEPVLDQAEGALLREALDRRVIDSVDDVLRRHYNTARLTTALVGRWPLAHTALAPSALRQMPYRDMVEQIRGVLAGADGAQKRRLTFHNLRETVTELPLDELLPAGDASAWQPGELVARWSTALPFPDAVEAGPFAAGLVAAALAEDVAAAAQAGGGGDALARAVAAGVQADLRGMLRQERRPQTLYERLAQRWPVQRSANPNAWRDKSVPELRDLLSGTVLGLLEMDRAGFTQEAVNLWLERSVQEALTSFWPEQGEPGPWVLSQVCQTLNTRWDRPDRLHPSDYKQIPRDELRAKLLAVGAGDDAGHLAATWHAELLRGYLQGVVAEAAEAQAAGWDLDKLAAALADRWLGTAPPSGERLRARLTAEVVRMHLLRTAEALEPRVVAEYGSETVQGWLGRRLDAALGRHCSLERVCTELAARWPIGELDDGRLATGNHGQVRDALVAYCVEAAHNGGEAFVHETARLRLLADVTEAVRSGNPGGLAERWGWSVDAGALAGAEVDALVATATQQVEVDRAFRWETVRRWLRQSVEQAQSEHCNPEIANDRWNHTAFVTALEHDWPLTGKLSTAELLPLSATELRDRALAAMRSGFDRDPDGFLRETTRQRLVNSVAGAIGEHASLERLAEVLNASWPRDTVTTPAEIIAGRTAELPHTILQRLAEVGVEAEEAEVRRVVDRYAVRGEGGPDELEPVVTQILQRWPELGQTTPWLLDEHLVSEALKTRLWDEFQQDQRAFVRAVTLEDVPRQLERRLMLEAIDTNWCNHLEAMDYLREGINLRGYAQTDPFIAFRKEGRQMFENMLGRVRETVVSGLFETTDEELVEMHRYGRLGLQIAVNYQNVQELAAKAEDLTASQTPTSVPRPARREGGGGGGQRRGGPAVAEPTSSKTVTVDKVGRNDPCPCGSGKKYKLCCGRNG